MVEQNYPVNNQNGPDEDTKTSGQFSHTPVGKKQKIAAVFLVIFAVFVLFLWYAQFKQGLVRPLLPADQGSGGPQICQGPDCQSAEEERLRSLDTDGDGLSDWDELYVHGTSPYLEDSDSDGFSDYEEVMSGNDPNCPSGVDCYGDTRAASPEAAPEPVLPVDISVPSGSLEDLDAAGLRQMLIEAGMDRNILDQIGDEDLMNNFREVLAGS